jgi:uncharacterized tellurite resistance protein B-like protein
VTLLNSPKVEVRDSIMRNPPEPPEFEGALLVTRSGTDRDCVDATALISTLLVYTAKGDGSISHGETGEMLRHLSSHLGKENAEALEHLAAAVMSLANDQDIALRLRQIGDGLSGEEKEKVFSMVLDIALADGKVHTGEERAINFAGQVLGLTQNRIFSALREIREA